MGARVYGLCCRGEEFPVNIIDDVYVSWKLRDCKKQLGYSVKVFDETGKTHPLRGSMAGFFLASQGLAVVKYNRTPIR